MNVILYLLRHIYRKILSPIYRRFDEVNEEIKKLYTLFPVYLEYKKCNERKKVIYTCISGKYDDLRQHTYVNLDYDYICFTDNEEMLKFKEIGFWKIRKMEYTKLNNTKNSRWHKTHPHILFPYYEESIWIDANINIVTGYLFDLITQENKYKIRIPLHDERNCIYQEINAVLKDRRDTKEAIGKIFELLKEKKFPKKYGLNETNIIYREHNNKDIIKIMDLWWEMIEHYSQRDQLSLSYILWEMGITPDDIGIPNARIDKVNYKHYDHTFERL